MLEHVRTVFFLGLSTVSIRSETCTDLAQMAEVHSW